GGGRGLSGRRDGVPARHGGARALRQGVPGVRGAGAADRLRRERDQLLRALPDRRPDARRPLALAAAPFRLAEDARRAGGAAAAYFSSLNWGLRGPARGPEHAGSRGAPRLRRGAPNIGGASRARSGPPNTRDPEARHGSA